MAGYLIGYMIIYKQWVLPSLASVTYFGFDLPPGWVGGEPSQKPGCEFTRGHGSRPLTFLLLEHLSLTYAFIY